MTKKETCIKANCTKYEECNLGRLLIIPFEDAPEDVQKLLSFFLYSAPDVESVHAPAIPKHMHDSIFHLMLDKRHFKYKRFCYAQTPIEWMQYLLEVQALCL